MNWTPKRLARRVRYHTRLLGEWFTDWRSLRWDAQDRGYDLIDQMMTDFDYEGINWFEKPKALFVVTKYSLAMKDHFVAFVCAVKGHKHDIYQDWANPETGGMAGGCSRCGWWWEHTLY